MSCLLGSISWSFQHFPIAPPQQSSMDKPQHSLRYTGWQTRAPFLNLQAWKPLIFQNCLACSATSAVFKRAYKPRLKCQDAFERRERTGFGGRGRQLICQLSSTSAAGRKLKHSFEVSEILKINHGMIQRGVYVTASLSPYMSTVLSKRVYLKGFL